MAVLNLDSLVLRGVAVLNDGTNVELRLGTSYQTGCATPEIPFSMRHPSQVTMQEPFGYPAERPGHRSDADAVTGAGRSHGLAGVLSRSIPTTCVGRALLGRSAASGGTLLTTANLSSLSAKTAAAAGEVVNSRQLVNSNAKFSKVRGQKPFAVELRRSEVGEAWCKPATRTPPASTWGRGIR